ncbi:hypothetical protein J7L05_11015 [bacterium]|nr:hypothetical protein [bacterium]
MSRHSYPVPINSLYLDCPPGPSSITYAITASLPDQTGEPYEISEMPSSGILTPTGGLATISCRVDDHQDDVYDISSSRYSGGIVEGTGCINADAPTILDFDSSRSDMGCYGGPGWDW